MTKDILKLIGAFAIVCLAAIPAFVLFMVRITCTLADVMGDAWDAYIKGIRIDKGKENETAQGDREGAHDI